MVMKDDGKVRESKRKKHKIRKCKCPKCGEFNLDEQIELGNIDKIGNIKYVYCPKCGQDIIY